MTDTRFGRWTELRNLREELGIKQRDLAAKIGISPSHLANLEAGTRYPTDIMTIRLARALSVPVALIARFDGEDSECQVS